MEQLLRKLGINPNQNTEVILEELGKVQMEYLERLDSVEEEKRKNQLEADLKEIESAISSLSWMANRTATGMKRDKDNKDDFSDLKNQQEEESKTEIESGGDVEERLYDQALALMATPDYAKGVEMMRKLAEDGYHPAQRQMGKMYAEGNRVQKDEATAVEWYRKAAEQGNAEAQACLGSRYLYGTDGIAQDNAMALKWLQMAADQGVSYAQADLAFMYYNGQGVEQNDKKAAELFLKSAEQGNAYAQSNMGMFYQNGYGVEADDRKAAEWYEKAAEQGEPFSQLHLAWMYQYGEGVKQNADTAVKWYEAAAENGESQAYVNLGVMYDNGDGVIQDSRRAMEYFQKAANLDDANGAFNLGNMYLMGKGIDRNFGLAAKWYKKAAELGDINAKYNLGLLHKNGDGVEKSMEQAVKWWMEAAKEGLGGAQYNIGKMYELGDGGVKKDYIIAAGWYLTAAKQGDAQAIEDFKKIETNVNSIDMRAARLKIEQGEKVADYLSCRIGDNLFQRGEFYLAKIYYMDAAEHGYERAIEALISMHQNKEGIEENELIAILQRAREEDCNKAIEYLIQMGVEQPQEKKAEIEAYNTRSIEDIKEAVNVDDIDALFELGERYYYGEGIEINCSIAASYYLKAANRGHDIAKEKLAWMYKKGIGVEQNYETALRWYEAMDEVTFSRNANITLMYAYGYIKMKDNPIIFKYSLDECLKAVNNEWKNDAKHELADRYYYGLDGVKQNYRKAASLYKELSKDGYETYAIFKLAHMYENGEGVLKNPLKARELRTKAIKEQKSLESNNIQYWIGFDYMMRGAHCLAAEWFKKAIEKDSKLAYILEESEPERIKK